MRKGILAAALVAIFSLALPSLAVIANPQEARMQFSKSDHRYVRSYFSSASNIQALSPGLKTYLRDTNVSSRNLRENAPLARNLMRLIRPAPRNLTNHLSVTASSGARVILIGRNVVLLRSKGNIVLDIVGDIRMRF